jgi:hypothetical protein
VERPDFDSIKNFEEFNKYYWYREELIRICKARGLKADGSKIELYKVIEAYFSGEKILPQRKNDKKPGSGRKKAVTNHLHSEICWTFTMGKGLMRSMISRCCSGISSCMTSVRMMRLWFMTKDLKMQRHSGR